MILQWLLSIWWLALLWTYNNHWPRPFDDFKELLLYGGAGVFVCYQLFKSKKTPIQFKTPVLFMTGYLFCVVLSLFATPQTPFYEGFLVVNRLILFFMLIWFFSQQSEKTWQGLIKISVISAIAIVFLRQLSDWGLLHFWFTGNNNSFISPIGHISYYSDLMALHFFMGLYLVFVSPLKILKIFWSLSTALIGYGLWLSATRASYVGLLLGFFFCSGVLIWKYHKKALPFIGISFVCSVLLFLSFYLGHVSTYRNQNVMDRFSYLEEVKGEDLPRELLKTRWEGFAASLNMLGAHPFLGWGAGSFRFIYPEYAYQDNLSGQVTLSHWYMHPHNEILNQAAETGVVGLFFFLSLWVIGLIGLSRWIPASSLSHNPYFVFLAITCLTTAFISWQLSTNFLMPLTRLLTAFFAGILWKNISPLFKAMVIIPDRKKIRQIGGVLLVLVASISLISYGSSLYYVKKIKTVSSQEERIYLARKAYYLAPGAFDPYFHYALSNYYSEKPEGAKLIDKLYQTYPYVPVVLYQAALVQIEKGNKTKAIDFLKHSLANYPGFIGAQSKLKELELE